jgi:hypothetical protein
MIYAFAICLGLFLAASILAVVFRTLWRETGRRWDADSKALHERITDLEDRLFLKNGLPTKSEKAEHVAKEPIDNLVLGGERRDMQRRELRASRTMPDGESRRQEQKDKLREARDPYFIARGENVTAAN